MLLAKDEHKKLIEFSAKVPTCIIGHPFPLKTIMQSTVHYNDVYLYWWKQYQQNFKAGVISYCTLSKNLESEKWENRKLVEG